jgi:hypothetical protein
MLLSFCERDLKGDNMFTSDEVKKIRKDMEQVLKDVEKKYKMTIKVGTIVYSPDSFTAKLECDAESIDGKSFEQSEFERLAFLFGYKKSDYNVRMLSLTDDVQYRLIGFKPNNTKYPIIMKRMINGKRFKFGARTAKQMYKEAN